MDITLERAIGHRARGGAPLKRLAASLLVVGGLGSFAVNGTLAAFSPLARADAQGFSAGTVYLTSDGGGKALFPLVKAEPGATTTSYTSLTYGGTLPASVRLHGSLSGTGLARFLTVTVTRGTGRERGFVPDATDYTGGGSGVLYRGTLAAFPEDFEGGVVDPGVWQPGETHAYRFEVTLSDDPAAAGRSASADFLWEARNT